MDSNVGRWSLFVDTPELLPFLAHQYARSDIREALKPKLGKNPGFIDMVYHDGTNLHVFVQKITLIPGQHAHELVLDGKDLSVLDHTKYIARDDAYTTFLLMCSLGTYALTQQFKTAWQRPQKMRGLVSKNLEIAQELLPLDVYMIDEKKDTALMKYWLESGKATVDDVIEKFVEEEMQPRVGRYFEVVELDKRYGNWADVIVARHPVDVMAIAARHGANAVIALGERRSYVEGPVFMELRSYGGIPVKYDSTIEEILSSASLSPDKVVLS